LSSSGLEDPRVSAEEMDERRKENIAYEYLCHLEEAKVFVFLSNYVFPFLSGFRFPTFMAFKSYNCSLSILLFTVIHLIAST